MMHTFTKNAKVHAPLTDEQRITQVLGDNITACHLFVQNSDPETESANSTKNGHSCNNRSKQKRISQIIN